MKDFRKSTYVNAGLTYKKITNIYYNLKDKINLFKEKITNNNK